MDFLTNSTFWAGAGAGVVVTLLALWGFDALLRWATFIPKRGL